MDSKKLLFVDKQIWGELNGCCNGKVKQGLRGALVRYICASEAEKKDATLRGWGGSNELP